MTPVDDPRSRGRSDGRDRPDDRRYRAERELVRELRAREVRDGGHAFSRHVDVSGVDTARRATREFSTSDGKGRNRPTNATRWTSDLAMARAVDHIQRSREFRDRSRAKGRLLENGANPDTIRFAIRVPLTDALGGEWRRHVAGHIADAQSVRPARFGPRSEVVAVFRARPAGGWSLHTCYPTTGNSP